MQRNDSVWKRDVDHKGVVVLGMLSGLGGVVAISGVTFLLRFHNHRPVRLGSPHLGIVSLLGSLVAYAAVPLLILPPSSPYAQVRAWLLCLGCTLTQGPLLAKTWRIQKIFSGHSVYNRLAMRDGRMLRDVMVVALLDLLLLSAWHITTFFKPLHQVEPGGNSGWVQNWVWLGVLLFYKAVPVGFWAMLAWKIRGISIPGLADPGSSLLSAQILLLGAAAATGGDLYALQGRPGLLSAVTVFLCTTTTNTLHVLPRVRDLFWPSSSCRSSSLCHKIEDRSTSGAMYTDEQIFSILSMNSTMRHQICEKEQQLLHLRQQVQVASGRLFQLLGGENDLVGGGQRASDINDERTTYGKTSCEEQKIESLEDQCSKEEEKMTKKGERDLVFKSSRGIDDEVAIPGYIVREQGIETQHEDEELAGLIRKENQEGFVEELYTFSRMSEGEDRNPGRNEMSDCKSLEEVSEDVMIKTDDGDEKESVKHEELRNLIEEVCERLRQLGASENKGSIWFGRVRGVECLRETREKTRMKVQDPRKENYWETNSSDSSSSFCYETTPLYSLKPHPNFQNHQGTQRPLSPHPSILTPQYRFSSSKNILTPPHPHLPQQICPSCRNLNPSHMPLSWEEYHESNSSDSGSSIEDELAFHLPQTATFV